MARHGDEGLMNGVAHRERVWEAMHPLEDEGSVHEGNDRWRRIHGHRGQRGRPRSGRANESFLIRAADVHAASGDQGKERSSSGPDVRAGVDLGSVSQRLLGGHERGCAKKRARSRGTGRTHRDVAHTSNSKIENLELSAGRQEEIAGLDIAMNDAARVGNRQDVEQLIANRQSGGDGQPPPRRFGEVVDRAPFEELEDEVRTSVFARVIIENGDGPRVPHRVGCVSFAKKSTAHIRVNR